MKFEDAKVGMEVVVTGEQANRFPEGAVIVEVDKNDLSVKLKGAYGVRLWFWDINPSEPESARNAYDMSDIHLKDCGFRKLPPTTHLLAEYLGLDPEKVKCHVDKENGTITVQQGDTKAKAKKAPQDKWDFRLGMGLALCRLKEKVSESKKPSFHTPYFYVMNPEVTNQSAVGIIPNYFTDDIRYAMGNVFHTQEEAKSNCEEMTRRTLMIVEFCKKQGW